MGNLKILQRDTLRRGGFAGLKEHRLVMSPKVFGRHTNPNTSPGIGNFVYLADANFLPQGETGMHPHHEVDVISVMVEGRIKHTGTLEHGAEISTNEVQVQRAGAEGFQHNEFNPDNVVNRMIQLWVLPEIAGSPAAYNRYKLAQGKVTKVYGGEANQSEASHSETFPSKTSMEVAMLNGDQEIEIREPFILYITKGKAKINQEELIDGDLVQGENVKLLATENCQLIIIKNNT